VNKLISLIFLALLVLVALFADEMGWINIEKSFAKEESYAPPPRYGYTWITTPGSGESLTEKIFGSTTHYEFFQISSSGEWSSAGAMTCGFMRCW